VKVETRQAKNDRIEIVVSETKNPFSLVVSKETAKDMVKQIEDIINIMENK